MSTVIKVEDLSKYYRLGLIGGGTLSEDINRWIAKIRGKPNPLLKIDEQNEDGSLDGQIWALHDVSLDVKEGEILGIIGRNGAGKSTLLKILSRITAPTEGRVKIRGRVGSLLEVGTGFHPELTGRENIYLNGAILGMSRNEITSKLDEIIEFAEMSKFISTPVKRYSSGMAVRLAFAIAAHLEPEILIVDEVLAVGDYRFQKKCLGRMQDLSREGRTIIFVSHNLGAIRAICERGILLSAGRIQMDNNISDVIEGYMTGLTDKKASISFIEDKSKDIQLSKVSVYNSENELSSTLDMLSPFKIVIEYAVHNEVSGVIIGCTIKNQNGENILATADYDLDRTRLDRRKVGHHITSVEIPGELFNSGTLTLQVGISIPGKYIYDRQEALMIELFDSGSFVVNGGGEVRRNSLLLLGLPWVA